LVTTFFRVSMRFLLPGRGTAKAVQKQVWGPAGTKPRKTTRRVIKLT
jgi:hypothetical protein